MAAPVLLGNVGIDVLIVARGENLQAYGVHYCFVV